MFFTQKALCKHKDEDKLKEKGWGKTYNTNVKHKQTRVTLKITGKGNFRRQGVTGDQAGHFITVKRVNSLRKHDNLAYTS